jgi:hypothetical protein
MTNPIAEERQRDERLQAEFAKLPKIQWPKDGDPGKIREAQRAWKTRFDLFWETVYKALEVTPEEASSAATKAAQELASEAGGDMEVFRAFERILEIIRLARKER